MSYGYVAIVKYDPRAPAGEKELALWLGLDEVISLLVLDCDCSADDVRERCESAVAEAEAELEDDA